MTKKNKPKGRGTDDGFKFKDRTSNADMLTINQTTGMTNYPAWAEKVLANVLGKLGRYAAKSLKTGKMIMRPLPTSKMPSPEDEEEKESSDAEEDDEGELLGGGRTQSRLNRDQIQAKEREAKMRQDLRSSLVAESIKELAKCYIKTLEQDTMEAEKYCGILMTKLSPESRSVVESQELFDDVEYDLLGLWKLIKETHVTRKSNDPVINICKKEDRLKALRQSDTETISVYRKRFEREYSEAEAMGANIGTEESQVFRFVNG